MWCFFSHIEYMKDGLKHMRLKFYIEGSEPGLRGTVHTESQEVNVIYDKTDCLPLTHTHTHYCVLFVLWLISPLIWSLCRLRASAPHTLLYHCHCSPESMNWFSSFPRILKVGDMNSATYLWRWKHIPEGPSWSRTTDKNFLEKCMNQFHFTDTALPKQ